MTFQRDLDSVAEAEGFDSNAASCSQLWYLALYFRPSYRLSSLLHRQLWAVDWSCRVGRAGKVHRAHARASTYLIISPAFCGHSASNHASKAPGLAVPLIIHLDEDGLAVPAPQSPGPPVTPEFLYRSVGCTNLSWADIGMNEAKQRFQTLHTRYTREKNQMYLSEGK